MRCSGAGNFVSEVVWEKTYSPRNDAKGISARTDVILVYRNSEDWRPNKLARTAAMDARYTNPDNDPRGEWKNDNPSAPGAKTHQGMVYAIEQPLTGELSYPPVGACWRYGQEEMLDIMRGWSSQYELVDLDDAEERARRCGVPTSEIRQGVKGIVIAGDREEARSEARQRYEAGAWPVYFLNRGGTGSFGRKVYLDGLGGRTPENLWLHEEVGHTDGAKKEIQALFPGQSAFATPKPERLLERVLTIATNPGDLVLDVFAGSGTTAAVAHKMGRRWVTVELLPETVAAFTRPRLEKVVSGEDRGGISTSKERVAVEGTELPENTTPEAAQAFSSTLGKFADTVELPTDVMKLASSQLRAAAKQGADTGLNTDEQATLLKLLRKTSLPEHDLGPEAVKQLRRAARTRDEVTVNWHGGGGFDVATLSPVWVGTELDELTGEVFTYITEAATGDVLERSIAGHLGFYLTDGDPRFVGVKGRQYLAVIEGVVSEEKAEELAAALPQGGCRDDCVRWCPGGPLAQPAEAGEGVSNPGDA